MNLQIHFSEGHVKRIAAKMKTVSDQYEQLFINFGTQLFHDIKELNDSSETMVVCNEKTDEAIELFQKYFPTQSAVACRSGCSHCCSFPVECPPQTIEDIAAYIQKNFSSAEQVRLKDAMVYDVKVRTNGLKRHRCPFLDSSNTCIIYKKRPLACRWFTSPDPGLCKKSVKDGTNIPQEPTLHRIYQMATSALLAAAKHQGKKHEQVPFIPALLDALTSKTE